MYKNIAITKVVLVTSMNYNTSENDLRNFFASCGKIINIRFLYDKQGVATGSAYVAFDSHEAALKAYAKDDTCLRDRFLRVALNRTDAIEEIMTRKEPSSNIEQQEEKPQNETPVQNADYINIHKDQSDQNSANEKSEDKPSKPKDRHKHHHKHHKHHRHKKHHHGSDESSSDEGVRYYTELPE